MASVLGGRMPGLGRSATPSCSGPAVRAAGPLGVPPAHSSGRACRRRVHPELVQLLPDPEVARLGRTLKQWRAEYLGRFDTGGAKQRGHRGHRRPHRTAPPHRPRLPKQRQLPAQNAPDRRRGCDCDPTSSAKSHLSADGCGSPAIRLSLFSRLPPLVSRSGSVCGYRIWRCGAAMAW